jgi:serine/threonine-protein kinase
MSAPTSTRSDPSLPATAEYGAAELPTGARLQGGRYVIRSVLGRGGFGITYETLDRRLERRVAVKELFPDGVSRHGQTVVAPPHVAESFAAARSRFLREAAVLAQFTHPGIVHVHEVFEENRTAYLVMELLEGRTIADVLAARGGPVTEAEALDVATRCAQALVTVHDAGVLHRDINPSNIVITTSGRVVLIDFGLAHAFEDRTGAMTRMVTPGYAPLEQYAGEGRFGPATDVYGLAATMYRMLTGRTPVTALDREHGTALPAPRKVEPSVSRLVSDAVLDGMELQPSHRPPSMPAFLARLGIGGDAMPSRALLSPPPAAERSGSARPADPNATRASGTRVQPDWERPDAPPSEPESEPEPEPVAVEEPAPLSRYKRPGFWKIGVPGVATVAAFGAVAPVLVPPVLALVVLPAIATAGDAIVFVRLRRLDGRMRWLHRVSLPPYVPARFARNVGQVLLRGFPALLLVASALGVTLVLDALGVSTDTQELLMRPAGIAAALLLVVPIGRDRVHFRVAVVGDIVARRLLDPRGRLTRDGIVACVVAAFVVIAGFGFHPELWPL